MKTLILILIIVLVGCNNNRNPSIPLQSQKKDIENSQVIRQIDTCENTKQIVKIINKTLSDNSIDFIDTAQFRMLLQENNKFTAGCYFPSKSKDDSLLYKFTDTLAYICTFNENALLILAILQTYNTTNAEYSEYFMYLFPKIAMNNIEMFIKGFEPLSPIYRKNILYDLGYLPDKETIEELIKEIEKISDPGLKSTINELIRFLKDENNFDF